MLLSARQLVLTTFCLSITVLSLSLSGCGTAAYEEKYTETLDALRLETPFKDLLKDPAVMPTDAKVRKRIAILKGQLATAQKEGDAAKAEPLQEQIAQLMTLDTVSLRLPELLSDPANTYALDEDTPDPRKKDQPLEENRIQPSFLKLPGHIRTYEHFVKLQTQKGAVLIRPLYCYVAVVKKGDMTAAQLKDSLTKQLVDTFGKVSKEELEKKRPKDAEPVSGVREWELHKARTPEGGEMEWQKVVAIGDQDFQYYDKDGEVKKKYLSGKYVLYLFSGGEDDPYFLLVAWRTRHNVDDKVGMEALADVSVGTVTVGKGEEDRRSKLQDL